MLAFGHCWGQDEVGDWVMTVAWDGLVPPPLLPRSLSLLLLKQPFLVDC